MSLEGIIIPKWAQETAAEIKEAATAVIKILTICIKYSSPLTADVNGLGRATLHKYVTHDNTIHDNRGIRSDWHICTLMYYSK